eukprot:scaffold11226_cov158-Isochrysis_galbana.AAC.1
MRLDLRTAPCAISRLTFTSPRAAAVCARSARQSRTRSRSSLCTRATQPRAARRSRSSRICSGRPAARHLLRVKAEETEQEQFQQGERKSTADGSAPCALAPAGGLSTRVASPDCRGDPTSLAEVQKLLNQGMHASVARWAQRSNGEAHTEIVQHAFFSLNRRPRPLPAPPPQGKELDLFLPQHVGHNSMITGFKYFMESPHKLITSVNNPGVAEAAEELAASVTNVSHSLIGASGEPTFAKALHNIVGGGLVLKYGLRAGNGSVRHLPALANAVSSAVPATRGGAVHKGRKGVTAGSPTSTWWSI